MVIIIIDHYQYHWKSINFQKPVFDRFYRWVPWWSLLTVAPAGHGPAEAMTAAERSQSAEKLREAAKKEAEAGPVTVAAVGATGGGPLPGALNLTGWEASYQEGSKEMVVT